MDKVYYTIGEVARQLDVKPHTIRYWESQIPELKPRKILNGIRHYRAHEIEVLRIIRKLLYEQGMKLEGARQMMDKKHNHEHVLNLVKKELEEILCMLN